MSYVTDGKPTIAEQDSGRTYLVERVGESWEASFSLGITLYQAQASGIGD